MSIGINVRRIIFVAIAIAQSIGFGLGPP